MPAPALPEQLKDSQQCPNASVGRVTNSQVPASLTLASINDSSALDPAFCRRIEQRMRHWKTPAYWVVSNILISVSTMDLFFQLFDMFQDQLDGLKALVSRGSVPPGVFSALTKGVS
ncbi:hypothetical protein TSAR_010739 [Trichomalopsis sarcophagae]|uniref:Uncharacterized protein n=1 Tax=Trichomalopsis sarcophagae TaxID=543379 RepID=A0A232EZB9_9HYME|nr:hypothetical protein TSAR_010739 [Trichomalopsis sarcophagae]